MWWVHHKVKNLQQSSQNRFQEKKKSIHENVEILFNKGKRRASIPQLHLNMHYKLTIKQRISQRMINSHH